MLQCSPQAVTSLPCAFLSCDPACVPAAVSWYDEFQRLYDTIPCIEVQALKEHNDQVLHLSFSHSGCLFASCSKDCTVKVRQWCSLHRAFSFVFVGLICESSIQETCGEVRLDRVTGLFICRC